MDRADKREPVPEGATPVWKLWDRAGREAEHSENAFTMEYREDGVFLTLYLATPLSETEQRAIVEHITRKKVYGFNAAILSGNLYSKDREPIRIAPDQEEHHYEEYYALSVENNQMEAYVTLSPPEPEGERKLKFKRVLSEIKTQYHIGYGIDEEKLEDLIENPIYDTKILIAQGKEAVTGKDGELIYHFEQRRKEGEYRIKEVDEEDETAKVNYRDLDLFEPVVQDQLLVTKIPPEAGEDGYTVLGKVIQAESGRLYNLPQGKNTYVSEDKLELLSGVTGRVYIEKDRVEVSNVYTVNGNLDISVGNLSFDGDIVIMGNVESGYTVKATGNVEVVGTIESAIIEAGGNVIAYGGIQAGGKGTVTAQKSVYARFMEYATVRAENMVIAESILNCDVECNGFIEVLNGRGNIIGGNLTAADYIAARYAGTQGGCKTYLEVGVSNAMKDRVKDLEKQLVKLDQIIQSLQRIVAVPVSANQPDHIKQERMDTVRKLLAAKESKKQKEVDLERYRRMTEKANTGQVHITMIAYPSVIVAIGNLRYMVRAEISYATFRPQEEEIRFTSCRFKKRPEIMPRMKK